MDVFVAGALIATAVPYAYSHWLRRNHHAATDSDNLTSLPPDVQDRLLQESLARFQSTVNNSVSKLDQDLGGTAGLLDKLVKRLGAEIVGDELERYRVELTELRKQTQSEMSAVKTDINNHRAELEAQLAKELAAEKERLIKQLDTKLADAVASFLVETLQHNIDLGAQEAYLKAVLEEHKADFISEVADEPATTK